MCQSRVEPYDSLRETLDQKPASIWNVADKTMGEEFVDNESMAQQQDHSRLRTRRLFGSTQCKRFRVWYYKSDIQGAILNSTDGFSYEVDLYLNLGNPNQPAGKWYQTITYTDAKQKTNEGMGIVTITFNNNAALSLAAVLGQVNYPITGGSGLFGTCPGGWGNLVFNRIDKYYWDIYVCDTCSPN